MNKKLLALLGAILVMSLLVVGCSNKEETTSGTVSVANPIVEYKSVEEMEQALGYDIKTPAYLPDGYSQSKLEVIGGKTAEIIYTQDSGEITYRTAKQDSTAGTDISGDYNAYDQMGEADYAGLKITTKGNEDKISVAVWVNDGYNYAMLFSQPVDKDTFTKIVENIK